MVTSRCAILQYFVAYKVQGGVKENTEDGEDKDEDRDDEDGDKGRADDGPLLFASFGISCETLLESLGVWRVVRHVETLMACATMSHIVDRGASRLGFNLRLMLSVRCDRTTDRYHRYCERTVAQHHRHHRHVPLPLPPRPRPPPQPFTKTFLPCHPSLACSACRRQSKGKKGCPK
jgi:hypothetical protein